jgi:hypothetical protein
VKKTGSKSLKMGVRCISVAVLPLIVLLGALAEVKADEADAKRMVKAMSDYIGRTEIHFVWIRFHPRSGHKRSSDTRFGEFGYCSSAPARQDPSDT